MRALSAVAFTHAPVAMTVADLGAPGGIEGERPRAVVINRAFADMLGYTVDAMLASEDQSRFTYGRDQEVDLEHVQGLLAGGPPVVHWYKRYVHADGHLIWARVSASVVRDQRGRPRYVVAQIREISEDAALEARSA